MISWDPGGYHPVTPALYNAQAGPNYWQIPEGWLKTGQVYYWHVRSPYAIEPWSAAASFSLLDAPAGAKDWQLFR
jgi:hypothetical protein